MKKRVLVKQGTYSGSKLVMMVRGRRRGNCEAPKKIRRPFGAFTQKLKDDFCSHLGYTGVNLIIEIEFPPCKWDPISQIGPFWIVFWSGAGGVGRAGIRKLMTYILQSILPPYSPEVSKEYTLRNHCAWSSDFNHKSGFSSVHQVR